MIQNFATSVSLRKIIKASEKHKVGMMTNLVWFKSDLRVRDNPALSSSMAAGGTIAVYVLCSEQWAMHGVSLAKQSLILRQLISLRKELASLNVPLIVVKGNYFDQLPQQLVELAIRLKVKQVYWNREYELNEKRCEATLFELLEHEGIRVGRFDDSVAFAPGSIRKPDGEPYKVFSAFKRALLKNLFFSMRPLYMKPSIQLPLSLAPGSQGLSDHQLLDLERSLSVADHYDNDLVEDWPSGEDHAHSLLDDFIKHKSQSYHQHRDFPSLEVISFLSPYLALGSLSTRQCMHAALNENGGVLDDGPSGLATWINELIWREFYRHILSDNEALCRFKPYKPETDELPWRHDREAFELWKNGQTGFPIVDAAMRQLNQTGWMHNRLRMVVAMFLTKHLFIDWRWGESYFMSKLIDGDFASNNGGWQWSASTGVDAVPYFRVFNPTRQSQRFDSKGDFIRRYVPELGHLSEKDIHQPSKEQALSAGYALPIVDHKQATDQTKYYFSKLNKSRAKLSA